MDIKSLVLSFAQNYKLFLVLQYFISFFLVLEKKIYFYFKTRPHEE